MSGDAMTYNQTFDVHITNNFENFKFDVFVFEVDEETGKSEDYECYKQTVISQNWNKDCKFYAKKGDSSVETEIIRNLERTSRALKGYLESNDKDRIIVIDNTPIPADGAQPVDDIILEYAISTNYHHQYDLREVSMYMGIATLVLSFAIGSLVYLSIKINRDIKRKFVQDEEDESDEEEDEDKKKELNKQKLAAVGILKVE